MAINDDVGELSGMLAGKSVRSNFLSEQSKLAASVNKLAQRAVETDFISNITSNAGDIRSGRFLALSAGDEPTDADATGAFMSAEGEAFGADTYNIGGVDLGVLQFGLSSETGKAIAGAGAVVLDSDGLSMRLVGAGPVPGADLKWSADAGVNYPISIAAMLDDTNTPAQTVIDINSNGTPTYPRGDINLMATNYSQSKLAAVSVIAEDTFSEVALIADNVTINGENANIVSGTWTPVIRGSGTAGTYQLNAVSVLANYVKIGRMAHLEALISMASVVTGGGTGYVMVTGLPFTKMAGSGPVGSARLSGIPLAGAYATVGFVTGNASATLVIYETITNAAQAAMPIASIGANDSIAFSISYMTS